MELILHGREEKLRWKPTKMRMGDNNKKKRLKNTGLKLSGQGQPNQGKDLGGGSEIQAGKVFLSLKNL